MSKDKEATIRYSNDEIVILWRPNMCIHSGVCVRGLRAVFDVNRRPWIEPLAASTQEIIDQIEKCPSGALSWERAETGGI